MAENIFWRELNLAHKHKIEYDKCYPKMVYVLAKNQDETKENHNNYVYELNKSNEKVTRHIKIKMGFINVRTKI